MTIHPTDITDVAGNTANPVVPPNTSVYRSDGKRLFDLLLVLLFSPIIAPLILLVALVVALDGHSPFYTQLRVGKNGRSFRIIKLRSMIPNADEVLETHLESDPAAREEWDGTQKLKDDPRITRVGAFIRKTSLDELPQLYNVLVGDMSLVGPRPMMLCQKELYPGRAYFSLRPGVTGYWQTSDRNTCAFRDRADFDESYDRDLSFATDVAVLLRTVAVVLRGTGY